MTPNPIYDPRSLSLVYAQRDDADELTCEMCGTKFHPNSDTANLDGWRVNVWPVSLKNRKGGTVQAAEVCSTKCLHDWVDTLKY